MAPFLLASLARLVGRSEGRGASQDPSTYGNPSHSCPSSAVQTPRRNRASLGVAWARRRRRRHKLAPNAWHFRAASLKLGEASCRVVGTTSLEWNIAKDCGIRPTHSFQALASMEVDVVMIFNKFIWDQQHKVRPELYSSRVRCHKKRAGISVVLLLSKVISDFAAAAAALATWCRLMRRNDDHLSGGNTSHKRMSEKQGQNE